MLTKKNWKDLFYKKHSENGYNQEEIEELYIYDMELQAFFDFGDIMPGCMKLQNKIRDEGNTFKGSKMSILWYGKPQTMQ